MQLHWQPLLSFDLVWLTGFNRVRFGASGRWKQRDASRKRLHCLQPVPGLISHHLAGIEVQVKFADVKVDISHGFFYGLDPQTIL